MITINTINNSWYFIGSFVIEPNTSVAYDETTLSQRQARDLILAFKSKRVFISYSDLDKVYIIRDGSLPPGGSSGASGDLSTKQDVLVSGTNIKTINGNSVLGSGDLVIEGGSAPSTEPPKVTRFETSGTWIPDPLASYVIIKSVGGGGNGAGVNHNNSGTAVSAATGGGSGAYTELLLRTNQLSESHSVTVGSVGGATVIAGIVENNPGPNGSVDMQLLGGNQGSASRTGSAPSTSSVTIGEVLARIDGQPSGLAAGISIGNGNHVSYSGEGGSNPFGRGGRSATARNGGWSHGLNGSGFGSGGSGAVVAGQGGWAANGGLGTGGLVIITEYYQ